MFYIGVQLPYLSMKEKGLDSSAVVDIEDMSNDELRRVPEKLDDTKHRNALLTESVGFRVGSY